MRSKNAVVLFSGGKDSSLALNKAMNKKNIKVKHLLNIFPENPDSFMFHKPDLKLLKMQAELLEIPLIIKKTKGKKEKELKDLRKALNSIKDKIETVVIGGIASSYQGKRIKDICDDLDLEIYSPLWDYSPNDIWEELLEKNFKVILTKISCEGIDKNLLGKIIDKEKLEKLKKYAKKYQFRIDFEGGEAESSVLSMPGMKRRIKIDYEIESEGKYRHFLKIKHVK